ncbi:MAG: hypothetical protein WAK58_22515, partial [Trebonia sp.]
MDPNTQRRDWFLTLDAQSGVADRSQALQAGYSRRAMAHRLKSAKWRRVQRGVYATFTGPVHREARLWAALRRAGPGAMLSHETAAEVHGLTDKPSAKIHITVPPNRHPAHYRPIAGVVIHRSAQSLPARLPEWELPRTRIEDTVLDLVATARTFDEAYSWISRALSKHLVSVGMLREAMGGRSRIRWRVWLSEALADADEGAYFPLERRYARDVERAHGLPKAERQAGRTIGDKTHYKDNWYADYRVCVELDGASYHQNDQVCQDKRRDNLNLAVDAAQTYR